MIFSHSTTDLAPDPEEAAAMVRTYRAAGANLTPRPRDPTTPP